MTTEGDDLTARIVRLERDVRTAQEKATAALVLARASDNDVATMSGQLNGHIRVLDALRETQLEHGERLDAIERKVDDGFRQVDENFRRIEERFAVVGAGLEHITALLTRDDGGERT